MNEVITTEKYPIKMWLRNIEDGALKQAKNLANLPFLFSHVAIMPDAHQGYGMPIGGVMATQGVVVPNAVGVDIGCGMKAVRTDIKSELFTTEIIKKIFGGSSEYKGGIRSKVPMGFGHQSKKQDENLMPEAPGPVVTNQYSSALKQLGTLGGGNHFIELQQDLEGFIWVMIHSGSRNLGFTVAHHYDKIAKELNKKWNTVVPANWDLAFLPLDTDEGALYMQEMTYCVEFAKSNRALMITNVLDSIIESGVVDSMGITVSIDVAHNYAAFEHHYGTNVLIHRKGATKAYNGELGIIPGSQGTASYIVKGKGNKDSFMSCSHGAGRKMGRKEAERSLSLTEEIDKLNMLGIVHGVRTVKDLDEAPGAYKDIDVVMSNQQDLVDVEYKLLPMAVLKG